jgi:hypothetical protein
LNKLINEDIFTYLNYGKADEGASFAVPNEIFSDLKDTLNYSYGKCAYAYAYYYLTMYMHLYAKYGSEETVDKFTTGGIQKILGISAESKTMNSITKKNGDLDILGYTSTKTDYPISLLRMENLNGEMNIHHYMYSEWKRDFKNALPHSNNFTVKHPDKMYWRTPEDKLDSYYNGTIYQADNTHIIPLEIFLHSLNNSEIGIKGFYVYGFILYNYNRFKNRGWFISKEEFSKCIDISERTLKNILCQLEKYQYISVKREKLVNGINKPNIYFPNLNPSKIIH